MTKKSDEILIVTYPPVMGGYQDKYSKLPGFGDVKALGPVFATASSCNNEDLKKLSSELCEQAAAMDGDVVADLKFQPIPTGNSFPHIMASGTVLKKA